MCPQLKHSKNKVLKNTLPLFFEALRAESPQTGQQKLILLSYVTIFLLFGSVNDLFKIVCIKVLIYAVSMMFLEKNA